MNRDHSRSPIMGPSPVSFNLSEPIATLPSKDAARVTTPNAAGDRLSVEPHTVLSGASTTGGLKTVASRTEPTDLAKKDQHEQLSPCVRATAARDIAFIEFTNKALILRPFGREI